MELRRLGEQMPASTPIAPAIIPSPWGEGWVRASHQETNTQQNRFDLWGRAG